MLRTPSPRFDPPATFRRDDAPAELAGLRVPPQEWRAIVTVRPNVLTEGPDSSTERLIRAITDTLRGPVSEWDSVSQGQEPASTLIVRHVDLLNAAEQRRLLDYLTAEGSHVRVRQVIATSTRPLYALVESGLLSSDLYYRLNTIRLELDEISPLED
jgi:hypothetical protein